MDDEERFRQQLQEANAEIVFVTREDTKTICQFWQDHEWESGRLVETGRHPQLGTFQKFLARCLRCGKETTETRWMDLSRALRGGRLNNEGG